MMCQRRSGRGDASTRRSSGSWRGGGAGRSASAGSTRTCWTVCWPRRASCSSAGRRWNSSLNSGIILTVLRLHQIKDTFLLLRVRLLKLRRFLLNIKNLSNNEYFDSLLIFWPYFLSLSRTVFSFLISSLLSLVVWKYILRTMSFSWW